MNEARKAILNAHLLPETVVAAWGLQAAQDFVDWLDQRLQSNDTARTTQISSFVARQSVNVLMLDHVSNLLLSGDPELDVSEKGRTVWRVPVYLTLSGHGWVGQVGELSVDAQTGAIDFDDALFKRIADNAQQLARQAGEKTAT